MPVPVSPAGRLFAGLGDTCRLITSPARKCRDSMLAGIPPPARHPTQQDTPRQASSRGARGSPANASPHGLSYSHGGVIPTSRPVSGAPKSIVSATSPDANASPPTGTVGRQVSVGGGSNATAVAGAMPADPPGL